MKIIRGITYLLLSLFIIGANATMAGVLLLSADGVLNNTGNWFNPQNVFLDDGLYALDTLWPGDKDTLRVSLSDPVPPPNCRITKVVLYVNCRTHYPKAKAVLFPYFNNLLGPASPPFNIGTTEVTRSYDITSLKTLLPDTIWDWDDITSLSVTFFPKTSRVVYFVDYIYAIVAYQDTLNILPVDRFAFSSITSPQLLGIPFPVTIEAVDALGQRVQEYNDNATLSDSTNSVIPPAVQFSNGVAAVELTITETTGGGFPPFTAITARDGIITGTSNGFRVINPGLHHFEFGTIPSPQTAGVPFNLKIAACDFFGDTITSFAGKVDLWDKTSQLSLDSSGNFQSGKWSGPLAVGASIPWDTIFCSYTSSQGTFTGASNGFEVLAQMGTGGDPALPAPAIKIFNARVSPNPVRGQAEIELQLPRQGRVTASVFNILGQEVMSRDFGDLPSGARTVSWRFEKSLKPGVYFFAISLDLGNRLVRKVSAVH